MLEFKLQVAGHIEIYSDKRGKLAEFDNIFLDQGLNALGTKSMPGYIWLGSGSAEPHPSNTQLVNFVARSNASSPRIPTTYGVNGTAPYYTWLRIGVRFTPLGVNVNLSELGLGTDTELYTRALIKDANGVPTTLTILSDEILDISYTIRIYAPTTDATGQITLGGNIGGTYDWTARACLVTTNGHWIANAWAVSRSGSYIGSAKVYSGPIGDITKFPSGSDSYVTHNSVPYVQNSFTAKSVVSVDTTQGNFVGGIRSISICLGWGEYQMQFDPAIPKTDLDTLNLTFAVTYARYVP